MKSNYSNDVADELHDMYKYLLIGGGIAFLIIIIVSIIIKSLTLFVIGVVISTFIVIGAISMLGKAEMIEKLQNIEDKLTK